MSSTVENLTVSGMTDTQPVKASEEVSIMAPTAPKIEDANGDPIIYDASEATVKQKLANEQEKLLKSGEKAERNTTQSATVIPESPYDFTIEKTILSFFEHPDNYCRPSKIGIYYGTQASTSTDIDIVAVGNEPQKAIDAFITYITKNNINVPFKLYPITYALYRAFECLTAEKKKKKLFPPSTMVEQHISPFTPKTPVGVVDILPRKYGYPSVNFFVEVQEYLKQYVINDTAKDASQWIGSFITLILGSSERSFTVRYEDKPAPTLFECKDILGNKVTVQDINDSLFDWFYGTLDVTTNSVNTSLLGVRPSFVQGAQKQKMFLTVRHDIYTKLVKEDGSVIYPKHTVTVQYLFDTADTAPKISLMIDPDEEETA